MKEKKPQKLYKYQSFNNYALKNLKNNIIYFSNPNSFNDPFDTLQDIKVKTLDNNRAKDLFFSNRPLREPFEQIENSTIKTEDIYEVLKLLIQSFETYGPLLSQRLGIHLSTLIHHIDTETLEEIGYDHLCAHIPVLYYEIINAAINASIQHVRELKSDPKGVACFSETVDNILMWAYYANGHTGFCLEFDTRFIPFTKLLQVRYVEELPYVDANRLFGESNDTSGVVEALLATKYHHWSHEKEWRVLHNVAGQEFIYESEALIGIYFGHKMDREYIEIISLIIKGQNPNCKLYIMEKIKGKFGVNPKEFEYTSYAEARDIILSQISDKINKGERNIELLVNQVESKISKDHVTRFVKQIVENLDSK